MDARTNARTARKQCLWHHYNNDEGIKTEYAKLLQYDELPFLTKIYLQFLLLFLGTH